MDQYDVTRSPSNLALLALRAPSALESFIDPDSIRLYRQSFSYLPVLPARTQESMLLKAICADKLLDAYDCLKNGADPDACDEVGLTALHHAGQRGQLELMHILVQKGANVNATTIAGETPLAYAVACNAREFTSNSQNAMFRQLDRVISFYVDHQAEVNTQDIRGMSPAMHASAAGDLVALHMLHRANGDVSLLDVSGNNAVHYAAANLRPHTTQQLMQWGIDPRVRGRAVTARESVMQAAERNSSHPGLMPTFNILVKAEAIAHARDVAGLPVKNEDLLTAFNDQKAFSTTYEKALLSGDLHLATAAINALSGAMGMTPPAENSPSSTFLQATASGMEQIVSNIYASFQAIPTVRDFNGRTALSLAIINGQDKLARMHISGGVPLDLGDCLLNTPLHYAALFENDNLVLKLLEAGANPLARNCVGRTPREQAIFYNSDPAKDSVTLLKELHGGYPMKADKGEGAAKPGRYIYLLKIAENEWQKAKRADGPKVL